MFAVIDVETTGFCPHRNDRVVEIAVVVVDAAGNKLREFTSVVNPERDVGPTRVHGLRARDLVHAPKFHEILPPLIKALEGTTALVGHKLRFDISFLEAEFERLGLAFPQSMQFCTMELAGGGSLSRVCSQFEIEFCGDAHSALVDATATAQLFVALLADEPGILPDSCEFQSIQWPKVDFPSAEPLTRDKLSRDTSPDRSYLQRLIPKMDQEPEPELNHGAVLAYSTLLAEVLEDRQVDQEEGEALIELASKWSIPRSEIQAVHRDFLRRIEIAALSDGVITDEERNDIHRVAMLLGLPASHLDERLNQAAHHLKEFRTKKVQVEPMETSGLAGKTICFTGELQCSVEGQFVTREMAIAIAERNGLIPLRSVSKKLNVLVAADPMTLSGKANKAREYGITIWSERQFWQSLGIMVR
jgi:DNA polymerase-3 subunit epsilon